MNRCPGCNRTFTDDVCNKMLECYKGSYGWCTECETLAYERNTPLFEKNNPQPKENAVNQDARKLIRDMENIQYTHSPPAQVNDPELARKEEFEKAEAAKRDWELDTNKVLTRIADLAIDTNNPEVIRAVATLVEFTMLYGL